MNIFVNIMLTKSAGGIVVNEKNQIVIVSNKGRSWTFPKGHVEQGEDPLTAAKREIYEESGIINLKYIKALGSYARRKTKIERNKVISELKIIYMFLFKTNQEILNPIDPNNPEAKWIDKKNVAILLTYKEDKEFFRNTIDFK